MFYRHKCIKCLRFSICRVMSSGRLDLLEINVPLCWGVGTGRKPVYRRGAKENQLADTCTHWGVVYVRRYDRRAARYDPADIQRARWLRNTVREVHPRVFITIILALSRPSRHPHYMFYNLRVEWNRSHRDRSSGNRAREEKCIHRSRSFFHWLFILLSPHDRGVASSISPQHNRHTTLLVRYIHNINYYYNIYT